MKLQAIFSNILEVTQVQSRRGQNPLEAGKKTLN